MGTIIIFIRTPMVEVNTVREFGGGNYGVGPSFKLKIAYHTFSVISHGERRYLLSTFSTNTLRILILEGSNYYRKMQKSIILT